MFSANSNGEEAAERVLDVHRTVGWISKIMSVHISYPSYNLSPSDLAENVLLCRFPALPFIFMTAGGQSLCSLKKEKKQHKSKWNLKLARIEIQVICIWTFFNKTADCWPVWYDQGHKSKCRSFYIKITMTIWWYRTFSLNFRTSSYKKKLNIGWLLVTYIGSSSYSLILAMRSS